MGRERAGDTGGGYERATSVLGAMESSHAADFSEHQPAHLVCLLALGLGRLAPRLLLLLDALAVRLKLGLELAAALAFFRKGSTRMQVGE